MPFAIAAAGIGLAGAVISSNKASKSQDKALDAQKSTADSQLSLGRDQLDFDKSVWQEGAPLRDSQEARATDVANSQIKGMTFAMDQAKDYQDYTNSTFRPLEKSIVADASAYDTPERRAAAAAAAQADVDQSFAATHAATDRDLGRSGIAPGTAKQMSIMQDAQIAQAAARAGAGTMAVRNTEQQGYARRIDAASLGRNLPAAQATQQQIATGAGTAAATSGMQAVAAQTAGVPNVNTGYMGAINAGNSGGNLYGSAAAGYGGVGSAISTGFGQLGKAIGSAGPGVYNYMSNLFSTPNPSTAPGTITPGAYGIDEWADGGPVRKEPTVGTKSPVREGGGGALSKEAVKALVTAAKEEPATDGRKLPANPLMNPRAIAEARLKDAEEYACGGPVKRYAFGGAVGGGFGGGFGMRGPMQMLAANDPMMGAPAEVAPAAPMPAAPMMQPAPTPATPMMGFRPPTRVDGVPMGLQPAAPMPAAAPRMTIQPVMQGAMQAQAVAPPQRLLPADPRMRIPTNPRMGVMSRAMGGEVDGPGGPKSDQIPAWLSDGEHVATAEEVTALGDGDNELGQARMVKLRKEMLARNKKSSQRLAA